MIDKFTELTGSGGPAAIIIIIVFVLILGFSIWWGISRRARQHGKGNTVNLSSTVSADSQSKTNSGDENGKTKVGTGHYKAMVYRKNGITVDFTTIPEPAGSLYQFDTSCPINGGGFIAKETKDGDIIGYDPRDVVIETEELPDWAWFAINCKEVVQNFWRVPTAWWKSVGLWFAAGMMLIVFICFLAVFGG